LHFGPDLVGLGARDALMLMTPVEESGHHLKDDVKRGRLPAPGNRKSVNDCGELSSAVVMEVIHHEEQTTDSQLCVHRACNCSANLLSDLSS